MKGKISDFKTMENFETQKHTLLITASGHDLQILDATTYTRLAALSGHDHEIIWANFSADNRKLVSVAKEQRAIVWDLENLAQIVELPLTKSAIAACFSVCHEAELITTDRGEITVWNYLLPAVLRTISNVRPVNYDAALVSYTCIISPCCNERLEETIVKCWDYESCQQTSVCQFKWPISRHCQSPVNSNEIAVGFWNGRIITLDIITMGIKFEVDFEECIYALRYHPGGNMLYGCLSGSIVVANIVDGTKTTLVNLGHIIYELTISPDETCAAVITEDFLIVDISTGAVISRNFNGGGVVASWSSRPQVVLM
jgi:WD40 repeat protein